MSILKNSLYILTIFLIFSIKLYAEEKKVESETIIITSNTLINDSKAKTATFDGNVIAKRGDLTLYANKMIVYYEDEQKGGNLKMIDAIGNIRLIKGDRTITSHKATYYPEPDEKVIFTGEPRVTEGRNLVTGEKITYYIKDDRALVEKSKVYLQERRIIK